MLNTQDDFSQLTIRFDFHEGKSFDQVQVEDNVYEKKLLRHKADDFEILISFFEAEEEKRILAVILLLNSEIKNEIVKELMNYYGLRQKRFRRINEKTVLFFKKKRNSAMKDVFLLMVEYNDETFFVLQFENKTKNRGITDIIYRGMLRE